MISFFVAAFLACMTFEGGGKTYGPYCAIRVDHGSIWTSRDRCEEDLPAAKRRLQRFIEESGDRSRDVELTKLTLQYGSCVYVDKDWKIQR